MHRSLYLSEILNIVFNFVLEDPEDKPGLKSLVALACACHTFHDTALNILWRSIPGFAPLLQTLPSDIYQETQVNRFSKVLSLKCQTRRSDWDRCKTYTPRIRRFGFEPQSNFSCTSDVIAAMERYAVLPLPNLQAYCCTEPPIEPPSPNMAELQIEVNYGSTRDLANARLTETLKAFTACPIRKLTIPRIYRDDDPSPLDLPLEAVNFISSLSRLEVLSIINFIIPDDALRMLASSELLRGLEINNTSEDLLRCTPGCESTFSELRVFSFRSRHISEASDLLHRVAPRKLQSIRVTLDTETSTITMSNSHLHKFFQTLETHCVSDMLTSIHVKQLSQDHKSEDPWNFTCGLSDFEPLLSFWRLRDLDLFFYNVEYTFDNSSIEKMTAAWPEMHTFRLDYETDHEYSIHHHITLDGLLPIARYWPQLEHLTLSFLGVVSHDEDLLQRPGAGFSCPRLDLISVGYSKLDSNPGVVAAFLKAIFPNLARLTYCSEADDWEPVSLVVEAMRQL
ncbi:hypothetical protein BDZ94DRAFT_1274913 [Collybia nuda]|uniref:F-box domain-containing protein n=1 Tax=Collybia nuda TaxID=64659 RepID=A0A9P5XUB8_9AGAR|nr:hypothetical protein BDZ94DRAFT_1274913 [Collybia nuda]